MPVEGTADVPLLAIDGAHRGRVGDGDAELATLELLFEQAPLDPLTGAELDALADAIRLYLDDGDGVFEPGTDDAGVFTEAPPFSLTDGVLTSTMVDGDPSVQLAVGAGASWWLAVDLAADAGSADPSTFRVTHRTTTSSTGEMSSTDLPLALEYQDDVASSILTVKTVLIFEDGFESGDTTAWTTSTP